MRTISRQGPIEADSHGAVYPFLVVGHGDKWIIKSPQGNTVGEPYDTVKEAYAAADILFKNWSNNG